MIRYLKFSDIDFYTKNQKCGELFDESPFDSLMYFSQVIIPIVFRTLLYFVECLVFIFLLPNIGLADRYFDDIDREYTVPYGYQRYVAVSCLGLILLLNLVYDFIICGIRGSSEQIIVSLSMNIHAFRILSLGSLKKWRILNGLYSLRTAKESFLFWIVQSNNGWKRFISVKTLLIFTYSFGIYNAFTLPYVPQNQLLRDLFLGYMLFRAIMYCIEFLNKISAFTTYLIGKWALKKIPKENLKESLEISLNQRLLDSIHQFDAIDCSESFKDNQPSNAHQNSIDISEFSVEV